MKKNVIYINQMYGLLWCAFYLLDCLAKKLFNKVNYSLKYNSLYFN